MGEVVGWVRWLEEGEWIDSGRVLEDEGVGELGRERDVRIRLSWVGSE